MSPRSWYLAHTLLGPSAHKEQSWVNKALDTDKRLFLSFPYLISWYLYGISRGWYADFMSQVLGLVSSGYVNSPPTPRWGLVTYMSLVAAFATRVNVFDWQKVCLIPAWSSLFEALDGLIYNKCQVVAARSWSFDLHSSEVNLIPWSVLKKGFDSLIQFWSWS